MTGVIEAEISHAACKAAKAKLTGSVKAVMSVQTLRGEPLEDDLRINEVQDDIASDFSKVCSESKG